MPARTASWVFSGNLKRGKALQKTTESRCGAFVLTMPQARTFFFRTDQVQEEKVRSGIQGQGGCRTGIITLKSAEKAC